VYESVPKNVQQEAVQFLSEQVFTTPKWLLDKDILSRTGNNATSVINARQTPVLDRILSVNTLTKLINNEANDGPESYQATTYLNDVKKAIFSEVYTKKNIDVFRRNLQKSYVQHIIQLLPANESQAANPMIIMFGPQPADPAKSDVSSIARAHLVALRSDIRGAATVIQDPLSKYHLSDLADRITQALEPK